MYKYQHSMYIVYLWYLTTGYKRVLVLETDCSWWYVPVSDGLFRYLIGVSQSLVLEAVLQVDVFLQKKVIQADLNEYIQLKPPTIGSTYS